MVKLGCRGQARELVSRDKTAQTLGSGDLPVYGTPAVLALVEKAAWQSIAADLEDEQSTVGTKITLEHLAATPLDLEVEALTELRQIDGRKLIFYFEVRDSVGLIAKGEHERFIVQKNKFLQRAEKRKA